MEAEQKRALLAKIDSLSPEEQRQVVGYVDALLQTQEVRGDGGEEKSSGPQHDVKNVRRGSGEGAASESGNGIDLRELRGALSHLKDEYTVEELQEKANEWRMKKAMDY